MAADYPLTLTIRAIDKVAGPLRAITAQIHKVTAPFKSIGKDWGDFSKAANLSGVADGLKGVGSAAGHVGSETFALGARMAAMASVAGFALFSVVHGAVEAGDQLSMMADRIGLSVDAYASLRHAANLADVDQEEFNSSMDTFSKRLGEAKANGGPLLEFLLKVSPVLAKQIKHVKSTEEGLSLMTDAFAKIPDVQRQAALSAAVFGKSSLQMGRFMHLGSAAIQTQQVAALRLLGTQEAYANSASDLDNGIKNVTAAFTGLTSAAAGALFPAFTKLTNIVTEFVAKNRDGVKKWAEGAATAISAWVDGGGIDRLVEGFKEFGVTLGKVIDIVGGFKGVAILAGVVMAGPLITSILGLIPAVISLCVALAPLATLLLPFVIAAAPFLVAAAGIAGIGVLIYTNWEPIKALFSALGEILSGLDDILIGLGGGGFDKVVEGWTRAVEGFKSTLLPVLQLMGAIPGVSSLAAVGIAQMAYTPRSEWNQSVGGANHSVERPGSRTTQANVSVDFSNLPAGARVSKDRNSSQPVDLSFGFSMEH